MQRMIQTVGFCQLPVVLGESATNFAALKTTLDELQPERGTLLVLPELWAGGFCHETIAASAAETPQLREQLAELGGQLGVVFAGSFAEEKEGKIYNSLFLCGGDGVVGTTRKQHLFPGEEVSFRAADSPPQLLKSAGVTVGGFICFDLRFPEIARALTAGGAELLVCTAQWPKARIDHWLALLSARAIENQCFVVAGNGCGESAGVELGGASVVISPSGEVLARAGEGREAVSIAIDWQEMEEMRSHFTSWRS